MLRVLRVVSLDLTTWLDPRILSVVGPGEWLPSRSVKGKQFRLLNNRADAETRYEKINCNLFYDMQPAVVSNCDITDVRRFTGVNCSRIKVLFKQQTKHLSLIKIGLILIHLELLDVEEVI